MHKCDKGEAVLAAQQSQLVSSVQVGNLSSFIFRHRILWLFIVASVAIVSDQLSKQWAQRSLTQSFQTVEYKVVEGKETPIAVTRHFASREIVVVPQLFHFAYKENPAAAFSITASLPEWFRRPFLLAVSSIATIFFLVWYLRVRDAGALLLTSFCLIMGGAVGNLIDRARLGYVIDFLDVFAGFIGYPNMHWPTFNIADSSIVVGAIGVIICSLRKPSHNA